MLFYHTYFLAKWSGMKMDLALKVSSFDKYYILRDGLPDEDMLAMRGDFLNAYFN